MNEFDDELRRIFGDDRLAVPPGANAVGRIVRGARRRRTVRMVASTAGSAGLVAAVAFGSMAVTGQFTAAPTYEPQPAESPEALPPLDPAAPPKAAAGPSGDITGDATGEPSGPSTAGQATEQPTGAGTDPGGGEQPAGVDESPVDVSALPLFDPAAPFDGVQVRMTLAELQQVPGVEITRLRADDLDRPQLCYGAFRTAQTHGYISLRGAIGEPPADLLGGYEVSRVVVDVPVRTPAGVGVGSTLGDVLTAYSDAVVDGDVVSAGVPDLGGVFSVWNLQLDGDVVTSIGHEGMHNCGDAPVPAPAPATADFSVPGGDLFGPVRLGMTLAELRATPGVEITEWTGRSRPYCYGEFRAGDVTGLVSVLRDISTGELPAPAVSEDEFVVSSIGTTAGGTVTPAGVGVGSTLDQVAAAQPGFTTEVPGSALPGAPATQGVRWTFERWDADVVQRLALDAGHTCIG
ncbi:hypothetical protein [Jiangella muralis]|uniref:hypothetical protein n=1 Tax=Jiangella muralis TaxID=702383 RepID=UPI00069E2EFA|nr:hypothetical protein [Jiangella muralis]